MAVRSLGEALMDAIAQGLEAGSEGIGVPTGAEIDAKKGASAKPAPSATGQRQAGGKACSDTAKPGQENPALPTMDRCMTTARPTSEPHRSAVVIHLHIWKAAHAEAPSRKAFSIAR